MKEKTVVFDNEIVKQGNSYCVRIPAGALKYLGFELGDMVRVKLSEPKQESCQEVCYIFTEILYVN